MKYVRRYCRAAAACFQPPLDFSENPWKSYILHPNRLTREKVLSSSRAIVDPILRRKAEKVADVGSFMWIDTVDKIAILESVIRDVPCDHILGLVIQGFAPRTCLEKLGKGSPTAQNHTYEGDFIKPIAEVIQRHTSTAFALVIEPGVIGDLVHDGNLSSCKAVSTAYYDLVPSAIKALSFPNSVIYLDAGHGYSLGWDSKLKPAAEALARIYSAAGKPPQVRGIATNIANYNSWDMKPGEFECPDDAQCPNRAVNEMLFALLLARELNKTGVPSHAIVDTSRNGVMGLRENWSDWCNVNGAGFGRRPGADTGSELADAFVWVKNGGDSDGASDPSSTGYDPACRRKDAFNPSPRAGEWNQAYFEMLVENAKPSFGED
ncbi:glycoside hydrolase family 6 protein [Thozetella sp. PMI_491]|nr:glycoside hydrolase family 6 protein [Thozetella sp. PMI_491]